MAELDYIGGKITVPGIYRRVSLARYHEADICDGPSLSSTGMRTITWESEADYWDTAPLNPRRAEIDEDKKRHFVIGRALHHIALGEPFFTKLFVERPETVGGKAYHWANKDWKRWIAEQRAIGKTILLPQEVDNLRGMMLSLARYPLIRQGIINGKIERSLFWKDKATGLWLKSRPDCIPTDSDDVCDVKVTTSVKIEELQKTIDKWHYYQQGALIAEGWRKVFGREMNSFSLVFVQHKRPYSVFIIEIEKEDLERGHALNEQAVDRFAKCLKTGIWPGPGGFQRDIQSLGLSKAARERIDNKIKYGAVI